jgi:hypothetical protein
MTSEYQSATRQAQEFELNSAAIYIKLKEKSLQQN